MRFLRSVRYAILVATVALHSGVGVAAAKAQKGESAEAVEERFMREANGKTEMYQARFKQVAARMTAVEGIQTVLGPAALTTKEGNEASVRLIAEYRSIVKERLAVRKWVSTDQERFLKTRAPSKEVREKGLAALAEARDGAGKLFDDLDAKELALMDRLSDVLSWASKQGGSLKAEGGQLVFSSPKQKGELFPLLMAVKAASEAQRKAVEAAKPAEEKAVDIFSLLKSSAESAAPAVAK